MPRPAPCPLPSQPSLWPCPVSCSLPPWLLSRISLFFMRRTRPTRLRKPHRVRPQHRDRRLHPQPSSAIGSRIDGGPAEAHGDSPAWLRATRRADCRCTGERPGRLHPTPYDASETVDLLISAVVVR